MAKPKLKPLHDHILIKPMEEEDESKGGIIIPDNAKEKPQEGEIIAAGKGRILDDGSVRALDVKVGDKVIYGKYAGTEVKLDGDEYLLMRESDVLGIVG